MDPPDRKQVGGPPKDNPQQEKEKTNQRGNVENDNAGSVSEYRGSLPARSTPCPSSAASETCGGSMGAEHGRSHRYNLRETASRRGQQSGPSSSLRREQITSSAEQPALSPLNPRYQRPNPGLTRTSSNGSVQRPPNSWFAATGRTRSNMFSRPGGDPQPNTAREAVGATGSTPSQPAPDPSARPSNAQALDRSNDYFFDLDSLPGGAHYGAASGSQSYPPQERGEPYIGTAKKASKSQSDATQKAAEAAPTRPSRSDAARKATDAAASTFASALPPVVPPVPSSHTPPGTQPLDNLPRALPQQLAHPTYDYPPPWYDPIHPLPIPGHFSDEQRVEMITRYVERLQHTAPAPAPAGPFALPLTDSDLFALPERFLAGLHLPRPGVYGWATWFSYPPRDSRFEPEAVTSVEELAGWIKKEKD